MNRRIFLKTGLLAVLASKFGAAQALTLPPSKKKSKHWDEPISSEMGTATARDLTVRFLGTGAAGWTDENCGRRRYSSALLDNKILIDFTKLGFKHLPAGCTPKTIFYTHSHGDHFSPEAALELGITKVYLNETWLKQAQAKFKKAATAMGKPMPEIIPLTIGQTVEEDGLRFTGLPATHATSYIREQAMIYLVEKGTTDTSLGVRLLYATDTAGIQGVAARIAGIDAHIKPGKPITALIMEATIPMNQEADYRMFNHSTPELVERTARHITEAGRYTPPKGQPVYLTHMSKTNFPPHDEFNKVLPYPLHAAYDGQEIILRPVD